MRAELLALSAISLFSGCSSINYHVGKHFVNPPNIALDLSEGEQKHLDAIVMQYVFGRINDLPEQIAALRDSLNGRELPVLDAFEANYHRKLRNYSLAEDLIQNSLDLIEFAHDSRARFVIYDTAGLIQKDKIEFFGENNFALARYYFLMAAKENTEFTKYALRHLEELEELDDKFK